jgi:hypothetical protein
VSSSILPKLDRNSLWQSPSGWTRSSNLVYDLQPANLALSESGSPDRRRLDTCLEPFHRFQDSRMASMNWTGGTLQRHSRGTSGSLTAVQRKYFAKSRIQQYHNSSPDFIHHSSNLIEDTGCCAIDTADDNSQNPRAFHSSTNGQDDDVTSPLPRRFIHGQSHESSSKTAHVQPTGLSSEQSRGNATASYVSKGQNSLPRPRTLEMKSADEAFSNFKQKLLEKKDWISTEQNKPVHIKFPRADQTKQFGKRRKIGPTKMSQSKPATTRTLQNQDPPSMSDDLIIRVDNQIIKAKASRRQAENHSIQYPHRTSDKEIPYNYISDSRPHLLSERKATTLGCTPGFSDEYLDLYGSRTMCSSPATRLSSGEDSTSGMLETPDCSPHEYLDTQTLDDMGDYLNHDFGQIPSEDSRGPAKLNSNTRQELLTRYTGSSQANTPEDIDVVGMYANCEIHSVSEELDQDYIRFDHSSLASSSPNSNPPTNLLKRKHEVAPAEDSDPPPKENDTPADSINGSRVLPQLEDDKIRNESAEEIRQHRSPDRDVESRKCQAKKSEDSVWMDFVFADMLEFT